MSIVSKLAEILGVSADELVRKGISRLLREELARVESEIAEILAKYNVKTPEELEEKFMRRELPEHPTWEDLLDLKHLVEERNRLREALALLEGSE